MDENNVSKLEIFETGSGDKGSVFSSDVFLSIALAGYQNPNLEFQGISTYFMCAVVILLCCGSLALDRFSGKENQMSG